MVGLGVLFGLVILICTEVTEEVLFSRSFKKTDQPWRPNYLVGLLQLVKRASITWSAQYGMQAREPTIYFCKAHKFRMFFIFCNDF